MIVGLQAQGLKNMTLNIEIFFTGLDSSSIEVDGNSVSSQSMLTLSKC